MAALPRISSWLRRYTLGRQRAFTSPRKGIRRLTSELILEELEDRLAPAAVRLAVIGDYGAAGQPEQDVSNLVHSWGPDLVITTGDNNYPDGAASTIDANIGQY